VSQWLADCVAVSSLFKHYPRTVIGTTIDTTIFVPRSRLVCRDFLQLEHDRQYILFGALNPTKDPRKGFRYLQAALQNLRHLENTELLLLGADQFPQNIDLGLPSRCLGKLFDDLTLSIAYNAADVVVVPSTQDACPKTALEALACSVPVACFDSTGLKDMVIHQVNGYRAQCFEPQDLAHGIEWILSRDRDTLHSLSAQARHTIEAKFLPEHQAQKYLEIYESMLSSP
jgi:glycosyltransferase involved in cell wall biosynthesis